MRLILNYSFLHHLGIYSTLIYAPWAGLFFALSPIYNFWAGSVKIVTKSSLTTRGENPKQK